MRRRRRSCILSKGFTARAANKLLDRTGQPFWQAETYDHWIRDEKERAKVIAYIEYNPVRAGLVPEAADFRWSSGAKKAGLVAGSRP